MARIITDDEFAEQLLKDIDKLKYGLKYYINKSKGLEIELEYFKNAYENRVNASLEREEKDRCVNIVKKIKEKTK